MKRRSGLLLLGLGFAACGAPSGLDPHSTTDASEPMQDAAEPPSDGDPRLTEILEEVRESAQLPAVAALSMEHREIVAEAAAGWRRSDGSEAVTRTDRWHLGSDTKAMTGALVALAVEAGELRFETTLGDIFGETEIHPDHRATTLAMLLQHRGGLAEDRTPTPEVIELFEIPGPPVEARAEVARRLLTRPAVYPPDTETRYANFGYVLVGAALERRTGQSWESLMRTRLFGPLGMESCGFGPPGIDGGAPVGHIEEEGTLRPVPTWDNPAMLGPAGTVHCNLRDWARFVAWTITPDYGAPSLGSEARARMLRPSVDGFAFGWLVVEQPWSAGPVLTHAGSNGANYAVAWVAPAEGRIHLAATNAGRGAREALDGVVAAMVQSRP